MNDWYLQEFRQFARTSGKGTLFSVTYRGGFWQIAVVTARTPFLFGRVSF
jgi:hypothetical protein